MHQAFSPLPHGAFYELVRLVPPRQQVGLRLVVETYVFVSEIAREVIVHFDGDVQDVGDPGKGERLL